jgi:hypothetical protein
MEKKIAQRKLEELIENRLAMQSTQRNLISYGVATPTLSYLKSIDFAVKFENLTEFQKRSFLQLIAGVYWKSAQNLITTCYK